jgi:hypothetical protein
MIALALFAALAAQAHAAPSPAELVEAVRTGRGDPRVERAAWDVLDYHMFEAFARRDPGVCAALAPLRIEGEGRTAMDRLCREKYFELVFVEAIVVGGPGRLNACVDDMMNAGASSDTARGKCAQRYELLDGLGRKPSPKAVVAACAKITQDADRKQRLKCPPYVRAFFGDDGDCVHAGALVSKREAAKDVVQCRSFALFRRAADQKDVKVCRGLPLCRALMGESGAVAAESLERAAGLLGSAAQSR